MACRRGTLTPSGHLVLSHLGFAFVHQTETTLPTCDAYRIWHIHRNLHTELERFQQNISNGCGMPAGDADSSGHLVLSHFGACKCSNVETNISLTCLVSGLLSFEHPSVLLFLLPTLDNYMNMMKMQFWNQGRNWFSWENQDKFDAILYSKF